MNLRIIYRFKALYLQTKSFFLNKKLSISFLILILIFLVGKCYYDYQEKSIPKPQTKLKSPLQIIEGLYLIDKNWNQKQKDSVLSSDRTIKIINDSLDKLLFITTQKDSILIDLSRIHSKNPMLLFNGNSSPFLTDLGGYENAKSLLFPIKKTQEILDSLYIPKPITKSPEESTSIEKSRKTRVKLEDPEYLPVIIVGPIQYQWKKEALSPPLSLEISDRSLFYPLLNNNQYLSIRFDNDFWDYTDYYYTNGIGISYSHPVFARSPLSYLLISNGNSGVDYYGLQIVQHMYTGSQPKVDTIIPGDRPWAAYTMIGQFLKSYDARNKLVHTSEINLGIIGKESGGGFIQDIVHTILPNNSPPEGWHNQIAGDYIIDYQYQIQKLLWETKGFESYITAGAQVGTLRDNIRWGFGGKLGNFIPFYKDISIYRRNRIKPSFAQKLRFGIVADIQTQLIGYDATLQGGVTNRTSVYVIPPGDISRFVIEGFGGITLSYARFELAFIQYWKSKEFKTAKDHKYVSVRLHVAF